MPAGYSGTPLAKKLGIKAGFHYLIENGPDHYFDLFSDFPDDAVLNEDRQAENLDFIHFFCQYEVDLHQSIPKLKPLLKSTGMLWVSWPKGKSKLETDLKREPIREYILGQGLVDVKVCAVDEDWSGLKFVYRLKDRK
ncbi:MAG: DUF3052 domain-containing protein [Bacteroidota bacterium]